VRIFLEDAPVSDSTPAPAGWWRKLLGPGRFTVFLVILLLAAAAAYLGVRAVTLSGQATADANARAEAISSASVYAVDLTTYDYRHLETVTDVVAAESTPAFARQYRATTRSRSAGLRAQHSVSTGVTVAAGVQDVTATTAHVLVLVDQSVTTISTPSRQTTRSALKLTLARTDTGAGPRWLISDLVLL
jgi:Mce-associated membrane protein